MSQEVAGENVKLFGWIVKSWLSEAQLGSMPGEAELVYCATTAAARKVLADLAAELPSWQAKSINLDEGDTWLLHPQSGPLLLVKPKALTEAQKRDGGQLSPSSFAQARDLLGRAVSDVKKLKISRLRLRFEEASSQEKLGGLVGLELGAYSYKAALQPQLRGLPQLILSSGGEFLSAAQSLATGTNIARHLVNTPPNILYPEAFASALAQLFAGVPGLSLEIWDADRLKREKMGLLLAVGQASASRPCLVKIRFRPAGRSDQPLALVGKGITFDSGGLDIKDPAGMRLMKKDMGGAAAIVGALYALVHSEQPRPVDVYIPLAENAISGQAFRPGDIIKARNGMTVEIHNTDAEGRLILADAMALAAQQTGADKPAALVVAATLTGAIKVGLGAEVAGYFSTDDELAQVLGNKAQEYGDFMWRMPLFDGYRSKLETPMADIVHCASGSFGGAITAALFLAEFAKGLPFAHLDIYAWADSEKGALREAGGSGQAVQALLGFLRSYRL